MGTGYTRNDTSNNIADGNIINASDLDGEFDAVEAAFNSSTGHTHDGTSAEGAPITVVGPVQDLVVSATEVKPKTTNTLDIGTGSLQFKDLHLDGTAYLDDVQAVGAVDITGDLDVDNININGNTIISTNTNGNIVLTPNGTGEVDISKVDIDSGTIDGTTIGGTTPAAGTFTDVTADGLTIDGGNTLRLNATSTTDFFTIIQGGTQAVLTADSPDGAGNMLFKTASAGVETDRMQILSNGDIAFYDSTGVSQDFLWDASASSLNVNGTITADRVVVSDGLASYISTFTNTQASNAGHGLYVETLYNTDSNQVLRLESNGGSNVVANFAGNGDISFYEDTGTTPKFFWDASAESLGLGTTLPAVNLHIVDADNNAQIRVENNDGLAKFQKLDDDLIVTNTDTGDIIVKIGTGETERLRVTSSGLDVTGTVTADGLTVDGDLTVDTNTLYVDSTNNRVGIMVSSNLGSALTIARNNSVGFMNAAGTAVDQIIYGDDSSNLRFYTNATERMRVTSGGSVGIGVSAPSAKLDVKSSGTSSETVAQFGNNNIQGGLQIQTNGNLDWGFNALNARNLTFSTNQTERMRIDSSGNLLVGYTSSNGAYKLQVNSQIFATSATIATSDGNYKENVTPLDGVLSLVSQLNPVQFDWKEHPVHEFDRNQPTIGFIAQEVQQVLAEQPYLNSIVKPNECVLEPEEMDDEGNVIKEAVTESFLGIAEGNMVALLTAAIKEQQAIITELEARITVLEAN